MTFDALLMTLPPPSPLVSPVVAAAVPPLQPTAAASRTSSFDKISLVFSILLAVFFLKEKVTWQIILGATLMAGGAVLIAFSREST